MSGAVYGIAGFVDGFIGGRNVKNSWEDRKRNIKRQERLDAMTAEEHAYRMKAYGRAESDWQRARDDEDYWRKVNADAYDATKADMATPEPMGIISEPAGAATSTSPSPAGADPVGGVASILGLPAPKSRAAAVMERTAPPESMTPIVRRAPEARIPMQAAVPVGPSFERTGRGAPPPPPNPLYDQVEAQGSARGLPVLAGIAEGAGPTYANGPNAGQGVGAPPPAPPPPDQPRYNTYPAPSPAIADELYQQGPAGVRYIEAPAGAAPPPGGAPAIPKTDIDGRALPPADPVELADMERRNREAAAFREGQLRDENLRRVRDGDGPIPLSWRLEADAKLRGPDFEYHGRGGSPQPAAMGIGPLKSKAPPSASPAEKDLAQTATDAMVETTTPAMRAASQAAGDASMGVGKGKAVTETQRKKAAGDFMEHYRKVGAPIVIEALLKRGEFEKAMKFQEFLDRGETKAGMENWARAAFAASVGDMDTFSNEIMEAYNRLDYFGDDTVIVKEESGFTKGRNGEITGAKITFRDEKTGNTFEQVFSDPNDLVRLGITLLAPEQAFEYYMDQQAAAAATAKDLTIAGAKEAKDSAKTRIARIDGLAKKIFDAASDPLASRVDADGKPLPPMTMEQAIAEATRIVDSQSETPAAPPPPVVYRPRN